MNALLRSVEYLATPKMKSQIIGDLIPPLESSIEYLKNIQRALNENDGRKLEQEESLMKIIVSSDPVFSPVILNIMNKFDHEPKIKDLKSKIISSSLDICDMVSSASPKRETIKYGVYNVLVNNLDKINTLDGMQERFAKHKSKIGRKRNTIEVKYVLYIIFIIIVILFKVLRMFND